MASNRKEDQTDDYSYARRNYYELLKQGLEVLPKLGELAEEAEHPRAYEVYFKALKDLADVNDKLLDTQRKRQVIDKDEEYEPPAIENGEKPAQIEFKGTTDDLLKKLESMKLDSEKDIMEAEYTEVTDETDQADN